MIATKTQDNCAAQLAFQDQLDRLREIQCALYHARVIMDGLHFERLEPQEIQAAAYFSAFALQHLADGMAEDAIKFAEARFLSVKQQKHTQSVSETEASQ